MNDKYKTQKDIEKKHEALKKRSKRLRDDVDIFKEEIKNICTHSMIKSYEIDADNGYGRWWKVKQTYCKICGAENV